MLSLINRTKMEETLFWKLLQEIVEMGDFVVAVSSNSASANIVGRMKIGDNGGEKVLEKEKCHCHIHLYPEKISSFSFTYRDVGYGAEPCCEFLTTEQQVALRLYYHGRDAEKKFKEFVDKNRDNIGVLKGSW